MKNVNSSEFCKKVINEYCKSLDLPEKIKIEVVDLPDYVAGRVCYTSNDEPIIQIAHKLIVDICNVINYPKEQQKLIKVLIHTMHHELCHIDIDRRNPIIQRTSDEDSLRKHKSLELFAVSVCINEYLACTLSYQTCPKESIKALYDFKEVKNDTDFKFFIKYILKPAAYFLGETKRQELMHRILA